MKKINYIFAFLLFLTVSSCTSMLDEQSRVDVDKDKFMLNAKQAENVLLGVYSNMSSDFLYGYHLSLLFPLSNDEAQSEGSVTTSFRTIPTNFHTSSSAEVENTWQKLYSSIMSANDFIESLTVKKISYTTADETLANVYIAEAKVLRALFYFELVRLYGNISLIKTLADGDKEAKDFTQANPADVYAFIEEDLKAGIDGLPWAADHNRPFRVSKGSAYGLLARVYATWAGYPIKDETKWALAADAAGKLVTSGKHKLNPKFEQIWKNSCNSKWDYNESLLEVSFYSLKPQSNVSGRIGKWNGIINDSNDPSAINGARTRVVYTFIRKWKGQNDPRYTASVAEYKWVIPEKGNEVMEVPFSKVAYDNGTDQKNWQICTPRKWSTQLIDNANIIASQDYSNVNWYIMRYSDAMLLYAEALNESQGSPSQEAFDAINMVRRRGYGLDINTPNTSVDLADMDQEEFRQAIRNERSYELCFEGQRRADLIRWGIYYKTIKNTSKDLLEWFATANYTVAQYTIEGKNELFPIPLREYDLMQPNYKQNDKW